MARSTSMQLYHLTLQSPKGVNCCVFGSFSQPKKQEVVLAHGTTIELLRIQDGMFKSIHEVDTFSTVRSLIPFRLTGGNTDHLVVGSDSGRIAILKFDGVARRFRKVHVETFGKTGCRRVVPGQMLATDPKGRAIMIASLEKQKLVYVMNRDASNRLTISSPLEAHKGQTICFDVCGIDCGFENPTFACIEVDYADVDIDSTGEAMQDLEKMLTYYELDLGLNNVVRKWSEPIDRASNMLVPIPRSKNPPLPGGVLVCAENKIIYRDENHAAVECLIPRRRSGGGDKVLIVSHSAHKQKGMFFVLLQSEFGDIYKVTLDATEKKVRSIKLTYFDTIPTCRSMCITKQGFLVATSEFSNHYLYQFRGLGDEDGATVARSEDLTRGGGRKRRLGANAQSRQTDATRYFVPRALKNLALVDEIDSLSPMTDMAVKNLTNEESAQIYALCGQGPRSSLRILRHGLDVSEIASSKLPGKPVAIWTIEDEVSIDRDRYIVVSFAKKTIVLSIGDTVEQVNDSGIDGSVPTIGTCRMEGGTILQVHETGLRRISSDGRVMEWPAPGKRKIVKVAYNKRQVVVALQEGLIHYFEIDETGDLTEIQNETLKYEISSLDIGRVPSGLARAPFFVVGSYDGSVRIFSLEPRRVFSELGDKVCDGPVRDVRVANLANAESDNASGGATTIHLFVGLNNGVLVRMTVDARTGKILNKPHERYLGTRAVSLFTVRAVGGGDAVIALSSRPWLCYKNNHMRVAITPYFDRMLEYAAPFSSEQCASGVVAVAGSDLLILHPNKLEGMFKQIAIPLRYTPRKIVDIPGSSTVVVIEADHNALSETKKAEMLLRDATSATKNDGGSDEKEEEDTLANEAQIGAPRPNTAGKWASCVHLINAATAKAESVLELPDNEAALSLCTCAFRDRNETFVCVGTAKDLTLHPRKMTCGFIHVYRVINKTDPSSTYASRCLQLLHKTEVEEMPYALCEFRGRLLVGVGRVLRMYDLGKRKLLRKCEHRQLPRMITSVHTTGDRIYVGDVNHGFVFLKYHNASNEFAIFADDIVPRFMTRAVHLDYNTMMGSDKFGNVFASRVPDNCDDSVQNPSGGHVLWQTGRASSALSKLDTVLNFHCGEVVTSLQKTSFVPGGTEVVVAGGIMGSVRAFVPLKARSDYDFFFHLEMYMRNEKLSLTGRDHLSFRSAFNPAKATIDGDLCECFLALPEARQKHIASEIGGRPVSEIVKKLESMRNSVL